MRICSAAEDTTAVGGTSLFWQIDKSCGEGDSDQFNELLRRLSGLALRAAGERVNSQSPLE
jgi:hypothetical protein